MFSFVCRIAAGTPTATEEADQIGYFAMQDLPRNTSHHQVERIRDALNAGAELTLKTQFGPSSLELLRRGKV